jgi:hypothetical protein
MSKLVDLLSKQVHWLAVRFRSRGLKFLLMCILKDRGSPQGPQLLYCVWEGKGTVHLAA